jgi:hypothetical protein
MGAVHVREGKVIFAEERGSVSWGVASRLYGLVQYFSKSYGDPEGGQIIGPGAGGLGRLGQPQFCSGMRVSSPAKEVYFSNGCLKDVIDM